MNSLKIIATHVLFLKDLSFKFLISQIVNKSPCYDMLAKIKGQLGSWPLANMTMCQVLLWEHCTHIAMSFFNIPMNGSYLIPILSLKKLRLRQGITNVYKTHIDRTF